MIRVRNPELFHPSETTYFERLRQMRAPSTGIAIVIVIVIEYGFEVETTDSEDRDRFRLQIQIQIQTQNQKSESEEEGPCAIGLWWLRGMVTPGRSRGGVCSR